VKTSYLFDKTCTQVTGKTKGTGRLDRQRRGGKGRAKEELKTPVKDRTAGFSATRASVRPIQARKGDPASISRNIHCCRIRGGPKNKHEASRETPPEFSTPSFLSLTDWTDIVKWGVREETGGQERGLPYSTIFCDRG